MSELGPDARSLVDAVLDADEPSANDAARVRAKVDARLALVAAGAVAATVGQSSSASAAAGGGAAGGGVASGGVASGGAAGGAAAGGGVASGGVVASATWMAAKIAIGVGLGGAAVATSLVIGGLVIGGPAGAPTSTTPSATRAAAAVSARAHPTSGREEPDVSRAMQRDATRQKEPVPPSAPRPPDAAPDRATPGSSVERARATRRIAAAPAPISAGRVPRAAKTPGDRARAPEGSATPVPVPTQDRVQPKPAPSPSSTPDTPLSPSPAKAPSIDGPAQGSATISAAKDSVVEEAALLHAARDALASGDAKNALALLDEHATRFPTGALVAERQAARVFSLCALGRSVEARRAAAAFLAQNARSPLAARVRNACSPSRSKP